MERREFVKLSVAVALASRFNLPLAGEERNRIPYRVLGRTGEKVSVIGLGGFHIGKLPDENESVRIIRSAVDRGINFLDNCWDYNRGVSEVRMGKALRDGYRQRVFLMTKIDGRDQKTAAQQIDESLRRLQTDRLDLLQFHEVIRMSDPERIFASNGAVHAAVAAQNAGKVRFIGFTGHKSPDIHLHMIETAAKHDFQFDTVQMPLNVMDAHFNSFAAKVVPVAVQHKIAILGMKPFGDHYIIDSKTATPIECLHYPMNLPASVVITGIDSIPVLDQALTAAATFKPMTEAEVTARLNKTAPAARDGRYELYKTSHHFDGTYKNPQWLGPGLSGEAPA
jgi:predicted aldo/keto reductase-like oxidoreductase